jgi:hypothetical protein
MRTDRNEGLTVAADTMTSRTDDLEPGGRRWPRRWSIHEPAERRVLTVVDRLGPTDLAGIVSRLEAQGCGLVAVANSLVALERLQARGWVACRGGRWRSLPATSRRGAVVEAGR